MKSRILSFRSAISVLAALAIPAGIAAQAQPQQATNPVPFLNQPLVPDAAGPGGLGFTLTVNGTGFVSDTKVNWNSSPLATTFVSESQLTATVPASNVATAGTASVTAVSPSPGGGTSNVAFFSVTSPAKIGLAKTDLATSGGDPEGEAVADFNGDGKLDLVVANAGCCGFGPGNTLAVLLGNGDGTFQPAVLYATGDTPGWVAVGDFNGDGKMDLVTANDTTDGTVSILLGNGDGTFQAAVPYGAGMFPETVIVADFNGDGKPDLVLANSKGGNTVSILLGNGDGTFDPPLSFATGIDPRQAITGDFNGDGKLDLATTNYNYGNGHTVSILLGNGDGTFQPHVDYPVGSGPFGITAADFNGDGKLDLAVTDGGFCCLASGLVSILLGNGDGTFQRAMSFHSGGSAPTRIAAADLNGYGQVDLAVTDISANILSVFPGDGHGNFGTPKNLNTRTRPVGILIADFNGDGRLDLAVTASQADTVSVLLTTSVALSTAKAGR